MGLEQLGKALAEGASQEKMDKPMFEDSNRVLDMELPEIDGSEGVEVPEGEFYPDSDRDISEGPQWDESGLLEYETPKLEDGPIEEVEPQDEVEEGNEGEDSSDDNEPDMEETEDDDSLEYNEDGTRELTEDEKQDLKDKLGWSDEKLKKCTIDENGVIHYKTDRCDLEGKTSENGVPYERRTIEINGVKIEGVFPKFDSAFDTELTPDNYKSKAYAKECNAKLKEAVENDPELKSKFSPEQLKDIEESRTPTGYVWHHNEEPGKMQLVKREDHDRAIGGAAHTGGSSLWGPDSVDNSKKGESF